MGVSPLAPETPPSHAALQHSKPGRGWAVAVGGVVCSAQTVPVRTQYDERRRRDPGRGKTGGEGRRKNNPVSGGRPLRGGRGTGMRNGGEDTQDAGPSLARQQASHRRWPAPPSSPRDPPPSNVSPDPSKTNASPGSGKRTSARRGQHRPTTWPKTKLMNLIFVLWQIFGTNCWQVRNANRKGWIGTYLFIFFSCSVETIAASLAVVSETALDHEGHGQHNDLMGPKWNHGQLTVARSGCRVKNTWMIPYLMYPIALPSVVQLSPLGDLLCPPLFCLSWC